MKEDWIRRKVEEAMTLPKASAVKATRANSAMSFDDAFDQAFNDEQRR